MGIFSKIQTPQRNGMTGKRWREVRHLRPRARWFFTRGIKTPANPTGKLSTYNVGRNAAKRARRAAEASLRARSA